MRYGIDEHRHRFSVWAAARAAQRSFTTVDNLRTALESSGVVEFLRTCDIESIDEAAFEKLHRSWCRAIALALQNAGIKNATFGRAAKLVAVYLKSMVVLAGKSESALSKVAHPPVDGILLRNVVRSPEVTSEHKRLWTAVRWTLLDEETYYGLIKQLRAVLTPEAPFWMLEQYWTVTEERTPS